MNHINHPNFYRILIKEFKEIKCHKNFQMIKFLKKSDLIIFIKINFRNIQIKIFYKWYLSYLIFKPNNSNNNFFGTLQ